MTEPSVPPTPSPVTPPSPAPQIPGAEKKLVAGLLGILIGSLGIHKFYLGYQKEGIVMLVAWVIGLILCLFCIGYFVIMALWAIGLIEGIIYLTKSDQEFVNTYVTGRKPWF